VQGTQRTETFYQYDLFLSLLLQLNSGGRLSDTVRKSRGMCIGNNRMSQGYLLVSCQGSHRFKHRFLDRLS